MLKTYLVIAFRNLLRHKLYSLINVSSLVIGLVCCILILLFVQDELSYDRHHEKSERIYRVLQGRSARTSYPLVEFLHEKFPEVMEMVRISCKWERLVSHGEKRFKEPDFIYADPNLFEVFSFHLLKGNSQSALARPFSVVITEEMARKYFGDRNPLGEVLRIDNRHDYTVTGVLADISDNSHFTFDFLATFAGAERVFYQGMMDDWGVSNFYTYLVLYEQASTPGLEAKMTSLVVQPIREKRPELTAPRLLLQPLPDIHLHSAHLWGDIEPQGNITYIYVFSAIAVFILLIACINFVNLSTARSFERMKEVGIRKMAGAHRLQLAKQFMGESILLTVIALLCSLALIELLLPAFCALTGKELMLFGDESWGVWWKLAGIALCVGMAAGSYPAFYLSSFRPMEVLKGSSRSGQDGTLFKRVLVGLQFSISIALIAGAGIIYKQMEYMWHEDLGFDEEHVAVVKVPGGKTKLAKAQFGQHPGIKSLSAASDVPPDHYFRSAPIIPEGAPERTEWMRIIAVDYNLIETLGLELVEGRNFSPAFATDEEEALILTEKAVAALGWDSPADALGKFCEIDGERTVVGVIRDFHFESLHSPLEPMAFQFRPGWTEILVLRMHSGQIPETLQFLEEKWVEHFPNWPFEYQFVDENFGRAYRLEEKTGKIVGIAALMAICVACLGLFGLTSFTTKQRTKEIGIRKVLGASVPDIVALLSKETGWLVVGANAVAWPVAYFVMQEWLENFAYKMDLGPGMFVLSGVLAFAIAGMTTGYQTIKAALANPIDLLRYE